MGVMIRLGLVGFGWAWLGYGFLLGVRDDKKESGELMIYLIGVVGYYDCKYCAAWVFGDWRFVSCYFKFCRDVRE